jgi:hypothetical protein
MTWHRAVLAVVAGMGGIALSGCSSGPTPHATLRCQSGGSRFSLDLVSSTGGSPTPEAAAVATAQRGAGDLRLPVGGWVVVDRSAGSALVRSDDYQLHVTQGTDGTWQVDSGLRCG